MNLQSSFTLVPVAKLIVHGESADVQRDACAIVESWDQLDRKTLSCDIKSDYRIIPGTDLQDITLPSRDSSLKVIQASPFEPLVHQRTGMIDGKISPLLVDDYVASQRHIHWKHWRSSSYHVNQELEDEDSSTVATESTFGDHQPPLSEIGIPLSHAVRQGMAELSGDDWKKMYFNTSYTNDKLQRYTTSMVAENIFLKRRLIQLQRQLNETRRNAIRTDRYSEPWSIPDHRSNKRQCTLLSQQEAPRCISNEKSALQLNRNL
jgi:hypothetical protein